MKIAFSPCPNDTFLFHAWVAGIVAPPPEVHLADIQELNQLALAGTFDLIKVSIATLPLLREQYELLPVGAALGFHCGPKLIAKEPFPLEELARKRVAIPGELTTAHLLLQKLCPEPAEKRFCLYHEVGDLIARGEVESGVIIHETRFTYQAQGFYEVVDLGEAWHERYRLPLPLGGLAIRRSCAQRERVVEWLRASLAYARTHPEMSRDYVLAHSQEKSEEVVREHIALYVNDETESLSADGTRAIQLLVGEV